MSESESGARNVTILYEDNHLLCAVKPRGILSQADGTGAPDMLTILKRYIKIKYDKKGAVYLGLTHRLDRPVGGVMVFARTSKAAGRISAQFRGRTVKKTYFAVLDGAPDSVEGRLEHRVGKESQNNIVRVSEAGDADIGGKEYAVLDYRLLDKSRDGALALVRVEPLTGRPHQIRAQFAYIGHPVAGDRKYGGRAYAGDGAYEGGRLNNGEYSGINVKIDAPALWAAAIAFSHPVSQSQTLISASPPNEYPWNEFDKKLYNIAGE